MKKLNIIYIFLFILPILDLISSITNRFFSNLLSLGLIIKGIAVLISVYYVIFKSGSKYRKISLYYYFAIFTYILLYFITKPDLLRLDFFITEINYLFKFIYFPIMTFSLINIIDEGKIEYQKLNKIMFISLIAYIILITIPTIFNINFNSYTNALYYGSVGWYYSANEISTILLLLFPFIYIFFEKRKILVFIIFSVCIYTIGLIGTKVTLFGIIIITFLIFVCSLLKYKKINNSVLLTLILFTCTIIFMSNNYTVLNMKNSLDKEQEIEINNIKEELKEYLEEQNEVEKNNALFIKTKEIFLKLLSNRDIYAINTYKIYNENFKNSYLLFGIGFSNTNRVNNLRVSKLIESDILDIFFHLGIIAVLILSFPFIYTLYIFIKNKKLYKFNEKIFLLTLIILLTVGISTLAGHVYIAPAVTIYISIYFIYLLNELKYFEKLKINNNKVSILALHMGYGGVENVIANVSSMLANRYEVEILSLYKKEEIPFKISDKVKIKYLLNTCSNKNEFKNALKEKNLFKIIKEGIKATYILINKDILIKKAIIECDSKIIISTRISFSKILNKFGRKEVIKIHQEHTYSVSDKYINSLNKLENINYIMPSSKTLYKKYEGKVKLPLKYIELALNNYPDKKELSSLSNKNLISIGRLEKEKDMKELIYILNELVKKEKNIYLNIFGDGSEKQEINELIKQYKLENYVKLWGYQNHEIINKTLKNSSLYLMTSLEESFGLVLIEAMSYGIPCITYSSAEGAKDIINEKNGFIINKRNRKEYVKKVINYLNLSQKEKDNYQKESRIISENYKYENIQNKWLNFIEEVLK